MAMYVLNLASLLFLVVSAIATAVPRAPELVDKRQTFNCQYPGSQAGNSGIGKHNDFTCKSTSHPNPVVLLHGLGATYYEDLNYFEVFLQQNGYCTYSLTYGDYPAFPFVGGLQHIADSAQTIGAFIKTVQAQTGASKIDIVGHSEGAFQSLYVPKFEGVAPLIDKIVAVAPPTHGTTFGNLYTLSYIGGNLTNGLINTVLNTVGCAACGDLVTGGPAVLRLNDGTPIKQPGNQITVIASRSDELVTPTYVAFVNETGVNNMYVQDTCASDPVGHVSEAYDTNVWNLIINALDPANAAPFACATGCPG